MHLRISRKRAKKSALLKLILDCYDINNKRDGVRLHNEAIELKRFS